MDRKDIDKLMALNIKATCLPWNVGKGCIIYNQFGNCVCSMENADNKDNNAAYIVEACNHIESIMQYISTLEAQINWLAEQAEKMENELREYKIGHSNLHVLSGVKRWKHLADEAVKGNLDWS